MLLLLLAAGCAKKGPPSGGPPDIQAPRLLLSVPDSGAANVSRTAPLELTFSEGMEPIASGDAVSLAPHAQIRRRRWSGHTLTVVLAESLRAEQSYLLYVGNGARDRHGNVLSSGASVAFTTAAQFPPGVIAGRVAGIGIAPAGAYLWCYPRDRGPDSTARDFDALGLADDDGEFRIVGLRSPGEYHLFVFMDVNRNRSFEPDADILAGVDTVFALTAAAPRAEGVQISVLNPRAPGRVAGAVIDSVQGGSRRVLALNVKDPARNVDVSCGDQGLFQVDLSPGPWKLRGYRDLNNNFRFEKESEPASDELPLEVAPASETPNVRFELKPPSAAGTGAR